MLKNYVMNEVITMETSSSLSAIKLNQHFHMYLPRDSFVTKSINYYVKALYADRKGDSTVLCDVNVHAVIEMRGELTDRVPLYLRGFEYIMDECMVEIIESETDCLLLVLWNEYEKIRRRGQQQLSFSKWMGDIFTDRIRHSIYQVLINGIEDVTLKETFQSDYDFIVSYFAVPAEHIFRTCE